MKKVMIAASLLYMTSCATILTGSKQRVTIASNTQDATVKVNLVEVGKTNHEVKIKRSEMAGVIQVAKPGCETAEMRFPQKTNGAFWVNIIPCLTGYGIIFPYFDLALGNQRACDREIKIDLKCGKEADQNPNPSDNK